MERSGSLLFYRLSDWGDFLLFLADGLARDGGIRLKRQYGQAPHAQSEQGGEGSQTTGEERGTHTGSAFRFPAEEKGRFWMTMWWQFSKHAVPVVEITKNYISVWYRTIVSKATPLSHF